MALRNRVGRASPAGRLGRCRLVGSAHPTNAGFTLVEMLVAMAITLVMMGAVVTLFANLSSSVTKRRATTEMSGQLRHVRNVLQQDLQGATCPGVTWQRPEANHGYIEIIEGQYREGDATNVVDGDTVNVSVSNPEIDHKISSLPSSNIPFSDSAWATDGGGLGDADDILMLTVRNEHEPFLGRSPTYVRDDKAAYKFAVNDTKHWYYETIRSPLAEVVWFAIENPGYADALKDPSANHFFGEPGYRTIYRRTLLIAPWLNPYRYYDPNNSNAAPIDTFTMPDGGTFKAQPGLLRILPKNIELDQALAAVTSFQDQYDLSVRLEWDGDFARWKIMANTLADLTKRENRFNHFGYSYGSGSTNPAKRVYPFPMVSFGRDYSTAPKMGFTIDPDFLPPNSAQADGIVQSAGSLSKLVVGYDTNPISYTDPTRAYAARPFTYAQTANIHCPAQAVSMLNDNGQVVRVIHGPAPLWGTRRGEDVMMSDVLAFDLRIYDPGAPMFATRKVPGSATDFTLDVVLTPSDPGWRGTPPNGSDGAYLDLDNMGSAKGIYDAKGPRYQFVGQGAYVDMGYGYDARFSIGSPPSSLFPVPYYKDPTSSFASSSDPWFFTPRGLSDVYGNLLAPGFAVYDTWSFHYENNGVNEDDSWFDVNSWKPASAHPTQSWRSVVDQGTDGIDSNRVLGIDDVGERETTPPYDKPLRGMQVLIRTYERDSRSIRQVRVNQHFMQE